MTTVGGDEPDLERPLEELREQQRAVSGVLRAVARSAGVEREFGRLKHEYGLGPLRVARA